MILNMKNMNSKTVLECVSDMESLHSNRAMWIYWGNFLKIHHLLINSTAMIGSFTHKCLYMWLCQCRDAWWGCKCVEKLKWNITVIVDLNWSSTMLGTDVETMLTQCLKLCGHHQAGHQHSHNVLTMLPECCLSVIPQY